MISAAIPFTAVQIEFAKKFFKVLRPTCSPPSRLVVSTNLLNNLNDIVKRMIEKKIQDAEAISIAVDRWTDIRFKSIFGIVIMFPEDGSEYVCDIKEASKDSYSVEFIRDVFQEAIDNIERIGNEGSDFPKERVLAIISDSAPNMSKGKRLLIEKAENNHITFLQ